MQRALLPLAIILSLLAGCGPALPAGAPDAGPSDGATPAQTAPVEVTTIERVEFAPGQSMSVVKPVAGGAWPVVVAYHGIGGSPQTLYPLANALASQGMVVFVPAWGAPPPARNDVQTVERAWAGAAQALSFARENATRYGAGSGRVIVVGHSWGAPLAVALALDGERFAPGASADAAVALDGPMDTRVLVPAGRYGRDPVRWNAMNPIEMLKPDGVARAKEFRLLTGDTWPESDQSNQAFAADVDSLGGAVSVTALDRGHMEMAEPLPEIVEAVLNLSRE